MKTIPLTRGLVALVDDEDYQWLMQWKWSATILRGRHYAVRNNRGTRVYMHRLLLKAQRGQYVDHRNGDGLDNRRTNIRLATNQQNCANQRQKRPGWKGVSWMRKSRIWRARIMVYGKEIALGCNHDPVEAARAYDRAALKHFGEFARLNFPRTDYGT